LKFLFFALVGLVIWAILKKVQNPRRDLPSDEVHRSGQHNASATPRRALNPAQQECHARLQSALSSMMILVQPRVDQLLNNAPAALASRIVDFAICGKDSLPIAVVSIDVHDPDLDRFFTNAGLRFANFRSTRLPDDQTIRETLGFL
jgi:hypothetical protein